jgi:hypothetical protein
MDVRVVITVSSRKIGGGSRGGGESGYASVTVGVMRRRQGAVLQIVDQFLLLWEPLLGQCLSWQEESRWWRREWEPAQGQSEPERKQDGEGKRDQA